MNPRSSADFLAHVAQRDPHQPEFLQAVKEVIQSLWPFLERHPRYLEHGLLERLVDVGDSRVKLSQKDPLRVLGVELDRANTGGSARLSYESNFFECCLIVNEYEQHQTSLPSRLCRLANPGLLH